MQQSLIRGYKEDVFRSRSSRRECLVLPDRSDTSRGHLHPPLYFFLPFVISISLVHITRSLLYPFLFLRWCSPPYHPLKESFPLSNAILMPPLSCLAHAQVFLFPFFASLFPTYFGTSSSLSSRLQPHHRNGHCLRVKSQPHLVSFCPPPHTYPTRNEQASGYYHVRTDALFTRFSAPHFRFILSG